jgi:hypothetical protein
VIQLCAKPLPLFADIYTSFAGISHASADIHTSFADIYPLFAGISLPSADIYTSFAGISLPSADIYPLFAGISLPSADIHLRASISLRPARISAFTFKYSPARFSLANAKKSAPLLEALFFNLSRIHVVILSNVYFFFNGFFFNDIAISIYAVSIWNVVVTICTI